MSSPAVVLSPELVGRRVRFHVSFQADGVYEGVVDEVDVARQTLTVSQLSRLGGQGGCGGELPPQIFSADDLANITPIDAVSITAEVTATPQVTTKVTNTTTTKVTTSPPVNRRRDRCVMSRPASRHLHDITDLFDSSLLLSAVTTSSNPSHHVPSRHDVPYVLIDSDESVAHLAEIVDHLCSADTSAGDGARCVGVSAEGVLVGRAGTLSLLSLCSGSLTVLVDLLSLDAPATAVDVLRPLLQSPAITKVLHDCRSLSDALFHQFDVRLSGVFDTQAADVCVQHAATHRTPAYVAGLAHTLVSRLNLTASQVFFPRYRCDHLQQDQEVWLHRPLAPHLVRGAICNVQHLCDLREVLLSLLLRPFTRCVDVYLSAVRDADQEDASAAPYDSHRLPVDVQQVLWSAPVGSEEAVHQRQMYRQNVLNNLDHGFRFTRNVWHASRGRKST